MMYKDKKVLIFGFGLLGGGLATTNWLLRQGAHVTITDLKTQEQLKETLDQVEGDVALKLGSHDKKDIDEADIIVVNPGVVVAQNEYIQYALKQNKVVTNEAQIFFDNFKGKTIAVTGTRGKTTVVAWISHMIPSSIIAGNNPEYQFLKMIDHDAEVAVVELASHHLELFTGVPDIAVITNISNDHLNRYGTMENYVDVKATIFKHQSADQKLILNADDAWTQKFKDVAPQSQVIEFNKNDAPSEAIEKLGEHGAANLACAITTVKTFGVEPQFDIDSLPVIPFRQEIIYQSDNLTIINDNNATSPEAGIVAIKRFGSDDTVLIAGGTDADMDFDSWAQVVKEKIKPENLILISGSATEKMKQFLNFKSYQEYEKIEDYVHAALSKKPKTILFSPAAKSFSQYFSNEYDRGRQFNEFIKKSL